MQLKEVLHSSTHHGHRMTHCKAALHVAGCLTCNLIGASQAGAFVSLVVSILRLL